MKIEEIPDPAEVREAFQALPARVGRDAYENHRCPDYAIAMTFYSIRPDRIVSRKGWSLLERHEIVRVVSSPDRDGRNQPYRDEEECEYFVWEIFNARLRLRRQRTAFRYCLFQVLLQIQSCFDLI